MPWWKTKLHGHRNSTYDVYSSRCLKLYDTHDILCLIHLLVACRCDLTFEPIKFLNLATCGMVFIRHGMRENIEMHSCLNDVNQINAKINFKPIVNLLIRFWKYSHYVSDYPLPALSIWCPVPRMDTCIFMLVSKPASHCSTCCQKSCIHPRIHRQQARHRSQSHTPQIHRLPRPPFVFGQ